jgi:hypothetical protein
MGSIFSSTSLPKEENKDDGWVMVEEEEALAEAKEPPQEEVKEGQVEEEEEEEEEESTLPPPHNTIINYPPLPHPEYNPWPWSPGLPCPAEVEYWSDVNGVHLTEAQLEAWERIAQEYGLKNSY